MGEMRWLLATTAIAALVLYVTAVHTPLYAEARYSLPAKPMILLLATVAVADLVGRFRHPVTFKTAESGGLQ